MNPMFYLNGSLPGCFRDEPKFENLQKCEVGCQVGTCQEANNTIGIVDGFKCECGPAHYGFNCMESTRLKVRILYLIESISLNTKPYLLIRI